MRSQSRFSRLLATEELNTALAHPSLHPLAFARLRHAAVPPSHLLFTMCSVSDAHALSDAETTYIAIFFEVRPIHACTLAPLWTVRPTSGNRRRIALATQGARCVTAVSCPPDPCKKIRHLPSQ